MPKFPIDKPAALWQGVASSPGLLLPPRVGCWQYSRLVRDLNNLNNQLERQA